MHLGQVFQSVSSFETAFIFFSLKCEIHSKVNLVKFKCINFLCGIHSIYTLHSPCTVALSAPT